MRAAVGLAWRGAAMVAFGATAALAVTLNRPVPAPAALTVAARPQPAPACAPAGLTVSLAKSAETSGYPVDFTNTSDSPCTLTACSATGPDARVYLRVRAIQPGTGSTANHSAVSDSAVRKSAPPCLTPRDDASTRSVAASWQVQPG